MRDEAYIEKRLKLAAQHIVPQYVAAIKWLQNYPSALIFPEDFLETDALWATVVKNTPRRKAVSVLAQPCYGPLSGILSYSGNLRSVLTTAGDVVAHEAKNMGLGLLGKDKKLVQHLVSGEASKPDFKGKACYYLPAFKLERVKNRWVWSSTSTGSGHYKGKVEVYDDLTAYFATKEDAVRYMHQAIETF
jgi:hypothetical protein